MRAGWSEEEIEDELNRMIAEAPENEALVREIAADAKERGSSWPLFPKFVPQPPRHLDEFCQ